MSKMGQFFPKTAAAEILQQCITSGESLQIPEHYIAYLRRLDVAQQFQTIIHSTQKHHAGELHTRSAWTNFLGAHFIVMQLRSHDDKIVCFLNFWPCSTCACIGFHIPATPLDPSSEEAMKQSDIHLTKGL